MVNWLSANLLELLLLPDLIPLSSIGKSTDIYLVKRIQILWTLYMHYRKNMWHKSQNQCVCTIEKMYLSLVTDNSGTLIMGKVKLKMSPLTVSFVFEYKVEGLMTRSLRSLDSWISYLLYFYVSRLVFINNDVVFRRSARKLLRKSYFTNSVL